MKPEAQIKALAELDGWQHGYVVKSRTTSLGGRWRWIGKNGEKITAEDCDHGSMFGPAVSDADYLISKTNPKPPNYLTSYDAIIPLIYKVCGEEDQCSWHTFVLHYLCVIKPGWWNPEISDYPVKIIAVGLCGTPEQLSESLLQATGKWIE